MKMEYIQPPEILLRLILAALAGGMIGLEREAVHRPAGLRTHMLVSLGSALFVLVTMDTIPNGVDKIIAGIATGIGFLGAGTIFKSRNEVQGLTTAASVWTVAAVGLAVGLGYYFATLLAVVLILVTLHLNKVRYFQGL